MIEIRRVLAALLAGLACGAQAAEDESPWRTAYIRSHYTKTEQAVPMRDGVRLFTSIYAPNDGRPHPILLVRTPYSVAPYGADRYKDRLGPTAAFEQAGFLFVFQDVRGRFLSEGEYVNMRPHITDKHGKETDESTDTYDTIAWLLEHVPGHNGKVGQWGISYPGFYTSAGAIDSHPALVAVSPQAPIADWFWDDMHHNGAFTLPLAFNFFASFGVKREGPTTQRMPTFDHRTPDGYQFFLELGPLANANARYFHGEIAFWSEMTAHPNYDSFWQARNILPHLKNIHAAVLVVGGLFDTEDLYGPLKTYQSIEKLNPKTDNRLVLGPWFHGQWARDPGAQLGSTEFGFATSDDFQSRMLLPFFLHHLLDAPDPGLAEANVFETGANRWRRFDAWPPRGLETRELYLRENGTLGAKPAAQDDAFDEYVSDPAKPVPYTMEITADWAKNYMTEDQRFAAWRPDVLVYRGEPLDQDLTLAGPIVADLWVSTTGGDADWVVKLIDVYPGELPGQTDAKREKAEIEAFPGGRQMLVRAEVMRGRFRESFERPKPFEPGVPTHVTFELRDVLHTFRRGHRVMVQVQSTWFPFVDRNPQSWVPNIFEANESDFVRATQRVYRSARHASHLRVGRLP
jgi:putative CocE/NonD family hydrolase